MTKIDWYILRKLIGTFIYSLMIFLLISVVIDTTEKIDDFMKHHLSLHEIIVNYYFGFIPHILALLFPLFIFLSVIFFTSKMAYRSEIIAILASGVSFRRFLRPYWMGAFLFGGILWLANYWVVPNANRIRTTFENKYLHSHDDEKAQYNRTTRIDSFTYVTFGSYDPNYKSGSNFVLSTVNKQTMSFKMKADRITWDSTTKKWRLDYVTMRTMNGLKEQWSNKQDTMLKIALLPKDLVDEKNLQEAMTTPDLRKFIKRESIRGSEGLNTYWVEYYRRTAAAFAVVVLTLIGGIIAAKKVRGGSGLHLALGIVISASYIIFLQFATVFSVKADLDPLLAVWIPNFIFGGFAFYLYRRAPK
ncbi:lipopolysaccharide export system permease protein [Chitinophaga polysaccharea]|uniref:Lipopolysaccharide export system permease protein n=1 Tax=Chitinophaga polysaccharea TaxID=1293035 RepID=A0A561Q5E7_9BACT|nr:LptF/LptG family permease [Chitinophaga polysaccharea]TWF45588.1 lipopolysaccharide export system permease protein [Chitinophaga polysaccharea]